MQSAYPEAANNGRPLCPGMARDKYPLVEFTVNFLDLSENKGFRHKTISTSPAFSQG